MKFTELVPATTPQHKKRRRGRTTGTTKTFTVTKTNTKKHG